MRATKKKAAAKEAPVAKSKKSNGSRLAFKEGAGGHSWDLFSRNGRLIASSGKYVNKLGAKRSWESVAKAVEDAAAGKLNVEG